MLSVSRAVARHIDGVGSVTAMTQPRRENVTDGAVGAMWAPGGRPRVVFGFTIIRGKITEIHLVADAERLRQLDLAVLND